jgi:HEAT repeat protein
MGKSFVIFLLVLAMASVSYCSDANETVKKILASPRRDRTGENDQRDIWQQHADELARLMVDVFPALTELLTDYDYGYEAAQTMLKIDRARALPLILKAAPLADRNVQNIGFSEFMSNYFAHSRDSGCATLAHAAAIAVFENEYSPLDTVEAALYVVGLTGSERDFPLLERVYAQNHRPGSWATNLRSAAEAALARLGSPTHLDNLKAELQRPLPNRLDLDTAGEIRSWLHEAAFIGSEELVPLVCLHLKDPAAWDGDSGIALSQSAASALTAMVEKKDPFRSWFDDAEKLSTFCQSK